MTFGHLLVASNVRRTVLHVPDLDCVKACRNQLPAYMVPHDVVGRPTLPRNPNGKIDRRILAEELKDAFKPKDPAVENR